MTTLSKQPNKMRSTCQLTRAHLIRMNDQVLTVAWWESPAKMTLQIFKFLPAFFKKYMCIAVSNCHVIKCTLYFHYGLLSSTKPDTAGHPRPTGTNRKDINPTVLSGALQIYVWAQKRNESKHCINPRWFYPSKEANQR